jgi:predicted pyridoxine 5'-phosphate oxidase superfamily flavin-nucleotide-binding protein
MGGYSKIAFTPAVKAVQEQMGSRRAYARVEAGADSFDALGEREERFLAERDSFYMASVGQSGWPYIQHRGGPKGFVRVRGDRSIAFADLRGNKQYVSVGNVSGDDRVALLFMDYPNRVRLKVLARATLVTRADDPDTFAEVAGATAAERVFLLRIEGLDWNCPQYITPRFTEEELTLMLASSVSSSKARDDDE